MILHTPKVFNEANVETALCLWEACLDPQVLSPETNAWLDTKREAEGTVALRHWIISLVEGCEAAWVADRLAGIEHVGFDWEHCPLWLDNHIRAHELGLPSVDEAVTVCLTHTLWVARPNGEGTTWIGSVSASDIDTARTMGKAQCAATWRVEDTEDLRVIGIAQGDVQILEWNDPAIESAS